MTITVLDDGLYEEVVDDSVDLSSALLAGAAPVRPPKAWYENPGLDRPSPLTITADGQVFGHVAAWNVNHIGLPGVKPPRSRTNYGFFKTGLVQTEEGDDVEVGQLTLAGGHAPLSAGAEQTVKHYDDTASAVADVTIGEDQHGIWVSGGMRPGVSDEQIRALRASAPSGDWRPINGNLELVAICQVNVPGFPIARAMVAGGEMLALVAAGASPLYALRQEDMVIEAFRQLESRVIDVENALAITASASEDEVEELDEVETDELEAVAASAAPVETERSITRSKPSIDDILSARAEEKRLMAVRERAARVANLL